MSILAHILGGILWCFGLLDQVAFRKPIERAIPNLERLLQEPRETLASDLIVIGPRRSYFVAIPMTVLYWLLGSLGVGFLWIAAAYADIQWGQGDLAILTTPTQFLLVVAGLASAGFALWRGHGGRLRLTESGIELHYRNSTVSCPWELLSAEGEPRLSPDLIGVYVPIRTAAVPNVEIRNKSGDIRRDRALNAPQLRIEGDRALLVDLTRSNRSSWRGSCSISDERSAVAPWEKDERNVATVGASMGLRARGWFAELSREEKH